MRMTLLNISKFTDEQVLMALKHVVPPLKLKEHKNMKVTITSAPGHHAEFYPSDEVVAHVTADEKHFPCQTEREKGQGYLTELYLDPMECLIAYLAHEFRHAWQEEHKGKKRGWVWGARRTGFSDRDADAYAIKKVKEYRRLQQQQLQENGVTDSDLSLSATSTFFVNTAPATGGSTSGS